MSAEKRESSAECGRHCSLEGRDSQAAAFVLLGLAAMAFVVAGYRIITIPAGLNGADDAQASCAVQAAEDERQGVAAENSTASETAPAGGESELDFAAILEATPAEGAAPADCWISYRGGEWQTGLSRSRLPETLRRRWVYQHGGPVVATAAIADGRVYVATDDGWLLGLRLSDGERIWSYETGARCGASPLVVNDLVVVGDDDGALHAVGAADGRRRWIVERGFMLSTSQFAGGYILTGGYDEQLQAVRPADGAAVWSWPNSDPVVSPATVIGDAIAVGGCDGKVHLISLADGKTIVQMEATAQIGAAMPWDGRAIYAATIEGNVSRFSPPDAEGAANGEAGAWSIDWQRQYDVDASAEVTHHAPQATALAGDRLVATFADGWLRCLRSGDGHVYWQRRPGGFIGGSAVIVDGRVVVGDMDGTLLVLSLADGKTLWRDVVGGRLTASPAVAEGCVVIGSGSGSIVCYGE